MGLEWATSGHQALAVDHTRDRNRSGFCFHRLNQVWTMEMLDLASSPSSVLLASESFDRGRRRMVFTQVVLVRPLLGGSQLSSLDYFHHDFREKSIHYQSAGGFEGNMIDLEQCEHTCSLPGTCRYTTLPGYHDLSCILAGCATKQITLMDFPTARDFRPHASKSLMISSRKHCPCHFDQPSEARYIPRPFPSSG